MFPKDVHEALALAFVQSHDLSNMTAAQINDLYYRMYWALKDDVQIRQSNVHHPSK